MFSPRTDLHPNNWDCNTYPLIILCMLWEIREHRCIHRPPLSTFAANSGFEIVDRLNDDEARVFPGRLHQNEAFRVHDRAGSRSRFQPGNGASPYNLQTNARLFEKRIRGSLQYDRQSGEEDCQARARSGQAKSAENWSPRIHDRTPRCTRQILARLSQVIRRGKLRAHTFQHG